MNTIEEKCKNKGVRLTDQRKVIAQVMSESKDHPDVDDLHKRVSDVDKKISIATVYRTVKLFEEAGILEKQFCINHALFMVVIAKCRSSDVPR